MPRGVWCLHGPRPPRARLMPRRPFPPLSLPPSVFVPFCYRDTLFICSRNRQINSSISHHDVSFVNWSAKCCSPGKRFILTLPDLVISCCHKSSYSTVLIFPSPHLDAIAVAAFEFQVLHHRLHSETLCCSRPVFDHCTADHHHASTRRLPLGPFRPIRVYVHVNIVSSACFHARITHTTFPSLLESSS